MSGILYECPYCGNFKPSENGTGSDVSCCGETGHAKSIGVTIEQVDAFAADRLAEAELEFPNYDEAKGG